MVNPAECRVCFTTFSSEENHRPRTFPCGHTCCSACITNLLRVETGPHLTCPACRVQHPAKDVTCFPINYGMEALIEQLKGLAGAETETEGQEEETSEAVNVEIEALKDWMVNLLLECNGIKMQLVQHQDELQKPQALHITLLTRLCDMVAENKTCVTQLTETQGKYGTLMDQGQDIMRNLQGVVDQMEPNLTHGTRTTLINLAQCRIQEMERWKLKYEKLKGSDCSASTSAQVLVATQDALKKLMSQSFGEGKDIAGGSIDVTSSSSSSSSSSQLSSLLNRAQHCQHTTHSSTLTTEDLRTLNTEVRRLLEARVVYGLHEESGCVRSSFLTLEKGSLHLYHLMAAIPPHHAITVPKLQWFTQAAV